LGRDREYASNAERQAAYRERLRQKQAAGMDDAERIRLMEEIRRLRREIESLRRVGGGRPQVPDVLVATLERMLTVEGEREAACKHAIALMKKHNLRFVDLLAGVPDPKKPQTR
jgi:hypothetical protein